jgi:serine/threonine protein kinase
VPSKEKGEYGYGMAADWWSVGVMIYEMLSGLPTFRGADLRQTYQKVLYAEVLFKPEEKFSPPARELILGLLHRDPAKRLGAGPNSPKDIMEISFFNGVNWQDIYNRVQDGPWVPPPDDFRRRQKGFLFASASVICSHAPLLSVAVVMLQRLDSKEIVSVSHWPLHSSD